MMMSVTSRESCLTLCCLSLPRPVARVVEGGAGGAHERVRSSPRSFRRFFRGSGLSLPMCCLECQSKSRRRWRVDSFRFTIGVELYSHLATRPSMQPSANNASNGGDDDIGDLNYEFPSVTAPGVRRIHHHERRVSFDALVAESAAHALNLFGCNERRIIRGSRPPDFYFRRTLFHSTASR